MALDHNIWLIEHRECDIIDILIYRHPTIERQYILLHLAARPSFFNDMEHVEITKQFFEEEMLEESYFSGPYDEEAGLYNDTYITRQEHDNGYAEIDGGVVPTPHSQLRTRNLLDDYIFLAPNYSVLNLSENENVMSKVYKDLHIARKIDVALLEPMEHLKRPDWMEWFD